MEIKSGRQLERAVEKLGETFGLEVYPQHRSGTRIWGRNRRIDIMLRDPEQRLRLGIECKYQGVSGSAEEKIPATIQDIEAWAMRGVVVIHGEGFSKSFPAFAIASGKVMWFEDLPDFLIDYFDLPMQYAEQAEFILNGDAPGSTAHGDLHDE